MCGEAIVGWGRRWLQIVYEVDDFTCREGVKYSIKLKWAVGGGQNIIKVLQVEIFNEEIIEPIYNFSNWVETIVSANISGTRWVVEPWSEVILSKSTESSKSFCELFGVVKFLLVGFRFESFVAVDSVWSAIIW